jgi:hypothetical protein
MMFSFFGVLRRASSEAQCQLVSVTRANLEATVAARGFNGIDGGAGGHRFEIDDLLEPKQSQDGPLCRAPRKEDAI